MVWCRCGAGVVPVWCRCGAGAVPVWCRCGAGVVPVWCRCGAGVVPVRCRCGAGAVPVWCRCGAGVVPVWCRCGAGVVPVWCRCPSTHLNSITMHESAVKRIVLPERHSGTELTALKVESCPFNTHANGPWAGASHISRDGEPLRWEGNRGSRARATVVGNDRLKGSLACSSTCDASKTTARDCGGCAPPAVRCSARSRP